MIGEAVDYEGGRARRHKTRPSCRPFCGWTGRHDTAGEYRVKMLLTRQSCERQHTHLIVQSGGTCTDSGTKIKAKVFCSLLSELQHRTPEWFLICAMYTCLAAVRQAGLEEKEQ